MASDPGPPRARRRFPWPLLILAVAVLAIAGGVTAFAALRGSGGEKGTTTSHAFPSPPPIATPGPVNTSFDGLTTFRGNLTRSYYGQGPVPNDPVIRWRKPSGLPMCSVSFVGTIAKKWCGTGWTGQPNVVVGSDGSVEVREGAYDGAYHFLDGSTGEDTRAPLQTRDLAKGSATSDPNGFPLYYGGSRDDVFRIIALDRQQPKVLWSINADITAPHPTWNNDWDGAALVVDGYLLEGGENGYLYIVRLNRAYDAGHLVQVQPEIVARIQGWDAEELMDVGDDQVSIENSVAFRDGVVYFANSGGLVQGWDISDLLLGGTAYREVLRYWTGDDTDASIVIDDQGMLYVASEFQRFNARSQDVGQLLKLDPGNPARPLLWGIDAREIGFEGAGGSWSTPALYGNYVYFTTAAGRVLEVDRHTGHIVWELHVSAPSIGSPVVVDGVLLQGDCSGNLSAWDVSDPMIAPLLLWRRHFNGCIESTPAVWNGWIYVGTRQGYLYGLADRSAT
ncbi:MAG: PQQ-binding-like beta-propeller repeat protein [Actinomycetota bacterium]|nr:PQQ-binding-like beta-propeller repeat protein [Actinomycetota bacterium]